MLNPGVAFAVGKCLTTRNAGTLSGLTRKNYSAAQFVMTVVVFLIGTTNE